MSVVLLTDCDLGAPELERALLADAGFELVEANCRTEEDVIAAGADAVGLLVQYAPVGAKAFARLDKLRAVSRYGTGVDSIDVAAARSHGVAVSGVPDYCTDEVADHTLALLLALTRGVVTGVTDVRRGAWPRASALHDLAALRDKTVGIIGVGRVGVAVAQRCAAFGCRVRGHDPYVTHKSIAARGLEPVSVDEAFASDIVSLHLPLNEETRGFANAGRLALMPRGGILLNVSRGGLLDETAAVAALDDGRLGGVGVDVLAVEPPIDSALASHPQALVTPHIAFYSPAALDRLRRGVVARLVSTLLEQPPVLV